MFSGKYRAFYRRKRICDVTDENTQNYHLNRCSTKNIVVFIYYLPISREFFYLRGIKPANG